MGRSSVAEKKTRPKFIPFRVGGRVEGRRVGRGVRSHDPLKKRFFKHGNLRKKGRKRWRHQRREKKVPFFRRLFFGKRGCAHDFSPCDASLISLQETRFFWVEGEEKEVPEKRWKNVWERGKELQNRTRKMQVSCGKYAH